MDGQSKNWTESHTWAPHDLYKEAKMSFVKIGSRENHFVFFKHQFKTFLKVLWIKRLGVLHFFTKPSSSSIIYHLVHTHSYTHTSASPSASAFTDNLSLSDTHTNAPPLTKLPSPMCSNHFLSLNITIQVPTHFAHCPLQVWLNNVYFYSGKSIQGENGEIWKRRCEGI